MSAGGRQTAAAPHAAWLFWALLAAFAAIYLTYYPRTYSIYDESSTLSLAYSIAHGSLYLDHAGPFSGIPLGAHMFSWFSPFHAAVLLPALVLNWRLAFLETAAFFVLGAFVIRAMLLSEGLSAGWSLLYFFLAGALFYSQTLMASLPASVIGLIGVWMFMRPQPRVVAGAFALGASVLLHEWMGPMAVVFTTVWCLERGWRSLRRDALLIVIGAAPCVIALGVYNYLILGSPFRDVLVSTGHVGLFDGQHLVPFLIFYVASLAFFPLGGWAVLSPRWARGWALPITAAAVMALASLYYYRDGLNVGSARLETAYAFAAGLIPGQRFLLPVSMVACLPAARFLDSHQRDAAVAWSNALAGGALALFIVGFIALSTAHQGYLDAHAQIQHTLAAVLPAEAEIVIGHELPNDDLAKDMAPTGKIYDRVVRGTIDAPAADAYVSYLALPGGRPPKQWQIGRRMELIPIRSWAWNRDLWIGAPADARTRAAVH